MTWLGAMFGYTIPYFNGSSREAEGECHTYEPSPAMTSEERETAKARAGEARRKAASSEPSFFEVDATNSVRGVMSKKRFDVFWKARYSDSVGYNQASAAWLSEALKADRSNRLKEIES